MLKKLMIRNQSYLKKTWASLMACTNKLKTVIVTLRNLLLKQAKKHKINGTTGMQKRVNPRMKLLRIILI
jgi:hypothetical protein